MNHVAKTIINLRKEYWPSWRSNKRPPVLKFAVLPTELLGSAHITDNCLIKFLSDKKSLLKALALFKLKAFVDSEFIVAKMITSVFDRVENTGGKGENAGYHHFLLFPQCFQKVSTAGLLKELRVKTCY